MNYWKRVRWIGSVLLIVLWLVTVIAGMRQADADQRLKALPCTACGL
jgi:hypothetical protein